MPIILSLLAIVFALKLAEATRGLEFDSWGAPFGAALVCWVGAWGTSAAFAALLPHPETLLSQVRNPWLVLGIQLGSQVVATMILLLVAWAAVPGVHVRRFSGLLVAAILVAVFDYAVSALIPAIGMGL